MPNKLLKKLATIIICHSISFYKKNILFAINLIGYYESEFTITEKWMSIPITPLAFYYLSDPNKCWVIPHVSNFVETKRGIVPVVSNRIFEFLGD